MKSTIKRSVKIDGAYSLQITRRTFNGRTAYTIALMLEGEHCETFFNGLSEEACQREWVDALDLARQRVGYRAAA